MKKTVWIFLLAVLLPSAVLGWLALRSAEEQQIVFERRTAELYQKETESLAASVREAVESERRSFGDTVHKLLAKGDASALARDFANTLNDAWGRRAVGFVIGPDGRMISPSAAAAAKNQTWGKFLMDNGSFLCSTAPAQVYFSPAESQGKITSRAGAKGGYNSNPGNIYNNAQPQSEVLANTGSAYSNSLNVRPAQPALQRMNVDEQAGAKQTAQLPADVEQKLKEPAPDPVIAAGGRDGDLNKRAKGVSVAAEGQVNSADAFAAGGDSRTKATDVTGRLAITKTERAEEAGKLKVEKSKSVPAATVAAIPPPSSVLPTMEKKPEAPKPLAPQAPAARKDDGDFSDESKPKRQVAAATLVKSDSEIATKPVASNERAVSPATMMAEKDSAGGLVKKRGEADEERQRIEINNFKEAWKAPDDGRAQSSVAFDKAATGPDAPFAQPAPAAKSEMKPLNRKVEPQQVIVTSDNNWSTILPSTSDFHTLTKNGDEGTVSRFVQDKLDLVFWIRPPEAPELVFGCLVDAAELHALWPALFAETQGGERTGERPPFVLALLDDKAHPVATHMGGETVRDWKHPFVSSEIGEMLPHWEAALYLASPSALADSARGLRRTLTFTIAGAVALIAFGGWLVVADARRQLALAQKKTDFVSNVSHELKTPLTSIRMFAELMHDRPPTAEKQGQYLRIISVEAERLTRLINNVLDFAKLERRQKRFEKKSFDFHAVIERVWESHSLHLRESGFSTRWEAAQPPYSVIGDEDALSQILVNLLSNAEKYSVEKKEIEIHSWIADGLVNVSVLDRGMGVPAGEEQKIYEAFYRAHDSLSSGIQGSGLGLTLAQRLAREHGGEILFERREGGGSRFTLRVPITNHKE